MAAKYVVGIDLGTTHCVVAYAPVDFETRPEIRIFEILQITAPNEIKYLSLLPSFIYLMGKHDVSEASVRLPWQEKAEMIVGTFARKRGSEVPHKLVASAKSWLCHSGVDRTRAILPWGSPNDVEKISPVQATMILLSHIRDSWNHTIAQNDEDSCLEKQDIFITVPASFDAVARELTVKAAEMAGLEHFTLLEEPQAAFYAWIEANEDRWRDMVSLGESILVCDIGGGTTDFSLIEVSEEDGNLALQRVAVGEHILLGGDNMDLTLAYVLREKISSKLDDWQFRALWYQSRQAKERLLTDSSTHKEPVVILGRGTSLIGSTIKTELTRDEVERVLLEGFFPKCGIDEAPQRSAKVGIREMGLPYEEDPAITRHLAGFLSNHLQRLESFPSAILFNGGVMKADLFRKRVLDVVRTWGGDAEVRELISPDLDLAVARGAAYYGFVCKGYGIRIKAGASRSYYVGIESTMPSVPGVPAPMKALCVVPFGMEEGSTVEIKEKEFGLVVGEPAVFHIFSSTVRQDDEAGDIVEDWDNTIEEVGAMETQLSSEEENGGTIVPVWIESTMTEIGTLELRCVDISNTSRKWKLEFNLKEREQKKSFEHETVR